MIELRWFIDTYDVFDDELGRYETVKEDPVLQYRVKIDPMCIGEYVNASDWVDVPTVYQNKLEL